MENRWRSMGPKPGLPPKLNLPLCSTAPSSLLNISSVKSEGLNEALGYKLNNFQSPENSFHQKQENGEKASWET